MSNPVKLVARKTALIVDDSALARRHSRRLLEAAGFAVVEAISGENAVTLFGTNVPDIVLLDMMLGGGMNGQETLDTLVAIDRACPIFVVTGDTQESTKVAMLARGAMGVILKPLTTTALASVMNPTPAA